MKKINYLIIGLTISMLSVACGGNGKVKEENSTEATAQTEANADYSGMEAVQLHDYDVPGTIYIPVGDNMQISMNSTGATVIKRGNNFNLEILPFGLSIDEFKAELESDLVYNIEYIEDTPEYIVYQKSIADSDIEPEFHFFLVKEFNGDLYELRSAAENSFKKRDIEQMLKSAQSLSFDQAS